MVYDITSSVIVEARQKASFYKLLLEGKGTEKEFAFFQNEIQVLVLFSEYWSTDKYMAMLERLRSGSITDADKKHLDFLMRDEELRARNARQKQERDQRSGVKY